MKENIGVFSTHPLWPSHLETDLEIIQREIDEGNEGYMFHCDSCIENCEIIWNMANKKGIESSEIRQKTCDTCITKQTKGFSLLKGSFIKNSLISVEEKNKIYELDDFFLTDREKLKQLVIDEHYAVGWAILSSLISSYRNPFIDVSLYKKELKKLYQDCSRIYFSTKAYIKKYNLTKIYAFNGRLSYTRGILDAATAMNIDCYVHERGSNFDKYCTFKNHTIHNIKQITERVREAWDMENDIVKKEKIGSQFFKDSENNVGGSWSTFLDMQDPSLLPPNWDKTKYNIALFTSSEDEFMSISSEWDNPFFKSQLEGLDFVSDFISKQDTIHLYIRVHPNTKHMAKDYIESLNKLSEYKNVTLIGFDSSISSYQLLKHSNKIVSFGSTMGMEAVYRKKPSILLGKASYYYLKGPYIPADISEIETLILDQNLPPASEEEAIKYGYFLKSFGINFKYYQATDYKSGKFRGIDLNNIPKKEWVKPNLLTRIKNKIIKALKNK
jgi:hypothetical protein